MRLSRHVKYITLPTHLLVLLLVPVHLVVYGIQGWWMVLIGWVLFAGVGTAAGHHRLFSHRSWVPRWPWVERFVLGCSIYAGQGSTVFWKALHIGYHHPKSDTPQDLHSPVNGWWQSYMGWLNKAEYAKLSMRGAVDLIRKKDHKFVHQWYELLFWLPLLPMAWIDGSTVLCLVLIPSFLAQHQENVVNLFCHIRGYGGYPARMQVDKDQSVNRPLLALFTWGEALHSNHHAFPRHADFGIWKTEFDPSRLLTGVLGKRV